MPVYPGALRVADHTRRSNPNAQDTGSPLHEMSDNPTIHVKYDPEERSDRRSLHFDNGDFEELLLTRLGADLYRCEESSLLDEIRYRDMIRAIEMRDGSLLFVRVEQPSELTTHEWLLSESILQTDECRAPLEAVMSSGGNWEQAFGGIWLLHTAPDDAEAFSNRVKAVTANKPNEQD